MHKYIQTHSSFYAWKVGKRKRVCEKCKREQKGARGKKECNRFNVLIKIPQQSCWYLYLFDFLFCHVAFDSVLCAYWVTPMCHARRPNAPSSQPYLVPVCFEVILFTQFFFTGFHCGKQWVHTELLASATCALNCRSEWKASPFRLTKLRAACKWWPVCIPCGLKSKLKYVQMVGKLVIDIFGSRLQTMANSPCAFIFPPSVLRFVVIVHLLHGVVIHASKLLFWVV